jgi:hypothetical protein
MDLVSTAITAWRLVSLRESSIWSAIGIADLRVASNHSSMLSVTWHRGVNQKVDCRRRHPRGDEAGLAGEKSAQALLTRLYVLSQLKHQLLDTCVPDARHSKLPCTPSSSIMPRLCSGFQFAEDMGLDNAVCRFARDGHGGRARTNAADSTCSFCSVHHMATAISTCQGKGPIVRILKGWHMAGSPIFEVAFAESALAFLDDDVRAELRRMAVKRETSLQQAWETAPCLKPVRTISTLYRISVVHVSHGSSFRNFLLVARGSQGRRVHSLFRQSESHHPTADRARSYRDASHALQTLRPCATASACSQSPRTRSSVSTAST